MSARHPGLATLLATVLLAATAGPAVAQSSDPPGTTTLPATTAASTATVPSGTATVPGDSSSPTTTQAEITADQVGPGILLDAGDRVELAQTLAESTEETGVCFGYQVSLSGSGAADRDEALSNDGPDQRPGGPSCTKGYLVVNVGLNYTSSSSESEDSASWSVVTDVPGLSGSEATKRLKALTDVSDDDLLGGKDDLALRNLTAALPLVLDGVEPAEESAVAPTGAAPNDDRLTGSPSSDWIRAHGVGIAIAIALLVVALVLVALGVVRRRAERTTTRRSPPSATPPGPGAPPSTTTTP